MESVPADVIRRLVLELSPRDVLSLCLSKKSFSKSICNSDIFWRNKIKIDYPKQIYPVNFYEKNPKRLYMLLTMNSKIIELDERKFPELTNINHEDEDDLIIMAENITNSIGKNLMIEGELLKRGDVLHLGWGSSYRNDDTFLWDGEKVVLLDYEIDDYGSVPKEFPFPEFRPEYFSESIVHNNIVRLTPDKIEETIRNFNVDTQTSFVTDRYNKYPIKIQTDISGVIVKYNKIFLSDSLEYDKDDKTLILIVPSSGGGYGNREKFVEIVHINSKWEGAIMSIIPTTPKTTYQWVQDTLEVTTLK